MHAMAAGNIQELQHQTEPITGVIFIYNLILNNNSCLGLFVRYKGIITTMSWKCRMMPCVMTEHVPSQHHENPMPLRGILHLQPKAVSLNPFKQLPLPRSPSLLQTVQPLLCNMTNAESSGRAVLPPTAALSLPLLFSLKGKQMALNI